jgi:hypothetical protein
VVVRVAGAAVEIGVDDAEVILGDMRELGAAGTLAQGPDARRRRFQTFIHLNISTECGAAVLSVTAEEQQLFGGSHANICTDASGQIVIPSVNY